MDANVEPLAVIEYSVSHFQTPPNSLVYVKTNVTVRRILLPTNGKIILKPSVTIRFSEQSGMPSCACVILFIFLTLLSITVPLHCFMKFSSVHPLQWKAPHLWLWMFRYE